MKEDPHSRKKQLEVHSRQALEITKCQHNSHTTKKLLLTSDLILFINNLSPKLQYVKNINNQHFIDIHFANYYKSLVLVEIILIDISFSNYSRKILFTPVSGRHILLINHHLLEIHLFEFLGIFENYRS